MSVQLYRFLNCNGRTDCMNNTTRYDPDGVLESSESDAILRGRVKKHGWHSTGDYDICPECYKYFEERKEIINAARP